MEHFDLIASWLKSGMDPHKVCVKLHLCPEDSEEMMVVAPPSVELPDACELCETTATALEMILQQNNSTAEMIRTELEMICDSIAGSSKCDIILEHFDIVVKWLEDGMDVHTVCHKLEVCPASDDMDNESALTSVQVKDDDLECQLCSSTAQAITVVSQVDPSSIPLVKQAVSQLCEYLPGFMKCSILLEHFDQLTKLVEGGSGPEKACATIKMCPASAALSPLPSLRQIHFTTKTKTSSVFAPMENLVDTYTKPSLSCALCVAVGSAIQGVHNYEPSALTMLKQSVGAACSLFPTVWKCDILLNDYDLLEQKIIHGETSQTACSQVKLCQAAATWA